MNVPKSPISCALLVKEAREYLLSFEQITPKVLDQHLHAWKRGKPATKAEVFLKLIKHAQNRQGMPNSIGKVERLRTVLCEFNPDKVLKTYSNWRRLFDAVKQSVGGPGRFDPDNKRSHWVIYTKSVLSCASFLKSFKSAKAFHDFVESFDFNEHLKLALPLLLEAEIFGFGFALACDFLKECGYQHFLKPDTHLNEICVGLGITRAVDDYGVFKDAVAYCTASKQTPYEFDKLLWLIGSGNFSLSGIKVPVKKKEFIRKMQMLAKSGST